MSAPKVFIDGHQGSTGLRINSLLRGREDLEFLSIDESKRKDRGARQAVLQAADYAVLCLPDEASEEAIDLIGDAPTRVVDTSSGRRLQSGWTYGLPELSPEQRGRIRESSRVRGRFQLLWNRAPAVAWKIQPDLLIFRVKTVQYIISV